MREVETLNDSDAKAQPLHNSAYGRSQACHYALQPPASQCLTHGSFRYSVQNFRSKASEEYLIVSYNISRVKRLMRGQTEADEEPNNLLRVFGIQGGPTFRSAKSESHFLQIPEAKSMEKRAKVHNSSRSTTPCNGLLRSDTLRSKCPGTHGRFHPALRQKCDSRSTRGGETH